MAKVETIQQDLDPAGHGPESVVHLSGADSPVYAGDTQQVVKENCGSSPDRTQVRAIELERMNLLLIRREKLLNALAECTAILLKSSDLNTAVYESLCILGKAGDFQRGGILQNIDRNGNPGRGWWKVLYEWSEGVVAQAETEHAKGSWDELEDGEEELASRNVMEGSRTSVSERMRQFMESIGAQYTINVPIHIDDQFWGVLAFDDCRSERFRSAEEKTALTAAAHVFGLAVHRAQVGEFRAALEQQIVAEREVSIQQQAAELVKANEVLRLSANKLVALNDLTAYLTALLRAACNATGAIGGVAGFLIEDRSSLKVISILDPSDESFRYYETEILLTGSFRAAWANFVASQGLIWMTADALKTINDFEAYHLDCCCRQTAHTALRVDSEVIGFVRVCFESEGRPSRVTLELLSVLAQQAAVAVRLKHLAEMAKQSALFHEREREAEKRSSELLLANTALQKTIAVLGTINSLEGIIPALLSVVEDVFAPQACAFFEADDHKVRLRLCRMEGQIWTPEELLRSDPEKFALVRILAEGFTIPADYLYGCVTDRHFKPTILDHVQGTNVPEFDRFAVGAGWDVELNVPILAGGKTIGAVVIYRERRRSFSDSESNLAASISTLFALSLQALQLAEEARKRSVEATIAREQEKAARERVVELARANEALKDVLDVLATEPEIKASIGHVLRVITEQLQAPSSAFWLTVNTSGASHVELIYHEGEIIEPGTEHPGAQVWPHRRDLAWKDHVLQRRPVIYDVETHLQMDKKSRAFMRRLGVKTLLGVPLLLGKEVIGSFTVRFRQRRDFTLEQLELVQALAHQATLALRLTRLSNEARHRAQESATVEERNRLAREIHDTIAQGLTGVVSQLEVVEETISFNVEGAIRRIHRAKNVAKQSLAEARRSVWALHPPELDGQSLLSAMKRLADRTEVEGGCSCSLQIEGDPYTLDSNVELDLYRIAQEGMRNAVKHAAASHIEIAIRYATDRVSIRVSDNGCGFPQQNLPISGTSFGLISMRQRAEQIGGQFCIQSTPGQGTIVEVIVPWKTSKGTNNHRTN